jgi:site-specific DNA recombinase
MTKQLRCAVYTRKSTEEGLEQDFNSLHAQREACEAYIRSQKHEGWTLLREAYDDGGYSGGSMKRPALEQLFEAIRAGGIDTVVVYKVDRLTRSLSDFARMVDLFDQHGVSFVSVTQQFNTTTSMGRLTLNVLLSFAQFEREVTAERIRDKIAASKKKGMWMGGPPPLGYDVQDRKLVINLAEAENVRTIFRLYLELGTIRRVVDALAERGIVSKRRAYASGKAVGERPITVGPLQWILANPMYIGQLRHKDKVYEAEHEPIIDQKTWNRVQAQLTASAVDRKAPRNLKTPNLLTGIVFDETGDRLSPTYTTGRDGRKHYYYVSQRLVKSAVTGNDGWRIRARDLDQAVVTGFRALLDDPIRLLDALKLRDAGSTEIAAVTTVARKVSADWGDQHYGHWRGARTHLVRVGISPEALKIDVSKTGLLQKLGLMSKAEGTKPDDALSWSLPIALTRRATGTMLVILATPEEEASGEPNAVLVRQIAKARRWLSLLASGEAQSVREVARGEGLSASDVSRIIPLAFLSPELVEAIAEGDAGPRLSVDALTRSGRLPICWHGQRRALTEAIE